MLISIFQAAVYVAYSFLAPIITAGGSLLVANVLSFVGIDLIRAAGLTSIFFLFNSIIVIAVFSKDIVWSEVGRFLPVSLIGSITGALFLVRISPKVLLFCMFCFSLYFIYQKLSGSAKSNAVEKPDSFLREQTVALLSGMVQGAALPGGGFRNAYFLSRGFSISQMHGTTNAIGILLYVAKISTLFGASILASGDFIGVLIAFPFLILSNILLRRGLIKLPKKAADRITLAAMTLFSIYAAIVIVL